MLVTYELNMDKKINLLYIKIVLQLSIQFVLYI